MSLGFPVGFQSTPVPNPILSSYLEEVDDLAELKVVLRALWLFHRKKGSPRPVRADDLSSDRTVAAALGATGLDLENAVQKALDSAARRGILIRVAGESGVLYYLNTAPERSAVSRLHAGAAPDSAPDPLEAWPAKDTRARAPNVFVTYEENIGELTPLATELLEEAANAYPPEWIVEAITEAVAHNARSWSYVAKILERWASEGRRDGEPGRGSETLRSEEFLRAYREQLRARGNR